MTTAAFFDLDRTLLLENSGATWFKRERAAGRLSLRQATEAGLWMGLYHLGLLHGTTAIERAVRSLKDQDEAPFAARMRAFWEAEIRPTIAPGGRTALEKHRAAGDRLVLLTSAIQYLAEDAAAELNIPHVLCVRVEVAGGRFTGRVSDPCFGPLKVDFARRFAAEHGVDLAQSWFYTDSTSDLKMLEAVGRPVVVQPDPRLRRLATRRGWPVEDWR